MSGITDINRSILLSRDSNRPVYLDLADTLRRGIMEGKYGPGAKLPTVRKLSGDLSLAMGTVKHAYSILEAEGLIEMSQGKGTFVLGPEPNTPVPSRKESAMASIDSILDDLSALGFSDEEIRIFFDLKLRQRSEDRVQLKVALAAVSPEVRQAMAKVVSNIPGVECLNWRADEVMAADAPDYDALVCSEEMYRELSRLEDKPERLFLLNGRTASETAILLSQIPTDANVGIVALSRVYAGLVLEACHLFARVNRGAEIHLTVQGNLDDFVRDKDVLIVPEEYLSFVSREDEEILAAFQKNKTLIRFVYECERGAYISLKASIAELARKKQQGLNT